MRPYPLALLSLLGLLLAGCPSTTDDDSAAADDDTVVDDDSGDDDDADDDSGDDDIGDDDTGDDDDSAPTGLVWDYRPDPLLALPVWTAWQDGEGAWQEVPVEADGVFETPVADADGRYALASACEGEYDVIVNVVLGTLEEMAHVYTVCPTQPDPAVQRVALAGSVAGLESGETAEVRFGLVAGGQAWPSSDYPTFGMEVFPTPMDAVASTGPSGGAPASLIVRREFDPTGGQLDLDFAAEGQDTTSRTLTITGEEAADAIALADLWTDGGTFSAMGFGMGTGVPYAEPSAPADGDRMYFEVDSSSFDAEGGVIANVVTEPGHDVVVDLPPSDSTSQVTFDEARDTVLTVTWSADPLAFAYVARVQGYDTMAMQSLMWQVAATTGRVGTSLSWSAPDWSGLAGWSATWQMTPEHYPMWKAGSARVGGEERGGNQPNIGLLLFFYMWMNSASSGDVPPSIVGFFVLLLVMAGGAF